MDVDPIELKLQLLRSLRGKRSQLGMSQALGYKYNQVAKWEGNFKRVYWNDFLQICALKKLPISEWVSGLYWFSEKRRSLSGKVLMKELLRIHFAQDTRAFCRHLGCRPSTFRRWLVGNTDIPLESVLRGLQVKPTVFLRLIQKLGCIEDLPALKSQFDLYEAFQREEAQLPFSALVHGFLATQEYQALAAPDLQLVAKRLHLREDQVERALKHLLATGALERAGGRYRSTRKRVELEGLTRAELAAMMRYWTYRALCSMQTRTELRDPSVVKNTRGFDIFAVSEETAKEISRQVQDVFAEITKLVENDPGPTETVRVVLFHDFDAAECPPYLFQSDPQFGFQPTPGE